LSNITPKEKKTILWIVVPCYNEEEVLPETAPMFLSKLQELVEKELIDDSSRILFVNDGSVDSTWEVICNLSRQDRHYIGISQSRNRGHQNAVLAGLMEAKDKCDAAVSIDCDGQDDINAIDDMIRAYTAGNQVVYGVRASRNTDTWFKRTTAQMYYILLNTLGVDVIYNHADYRLVSSRVLEELEGYEEVNLFLRGLFPLIGFKSTTVYYDRQERIAGTSHYPLSRMLALAFDGITSMTIKPIHIITVFGFFVALLSFIGVVWSVLCYFFDLTVSGWASMTSIVCFLGGIQLICLGVIGEYVGKTYLETKKRPRFIISERTWDKK